MQSQGTPLLGVQLLLIQPRSQDTPLLGVQLLLIQLQSQDTPLLGVLLLLIQPLASPPLLAAAAQSICRPITGLFQLANLSGYVLGLAGMPPPPPPPPPPVLLQCVTGVSPQGYPSRTHSSQYPLPHAFPNSGLYSCLATKHGLPAT